MGEVETSDDCSKWEETMYWTHFKTKHFSVYLVGDFADELAIPKKFANHLKNKLLEAVTLKGPSDVIWDVGMVTSGDNLFFKKGWKEFVINHSLEENDLLIFQYHGNSHFDVLVFDGRSLCEKETSYFVRKCGHKKPYVGYQGKEKGRGSSVEDIPAASDDDVECPLPKKPRKDEAVMPMSSIRRNAPRASRKIRKVTRVIKPATRKRKISKKEPSTPPVGEKVISDAGQNSINGSRNYQLLYLSKRRPITEIEKQHALQLAQAALTNESFIVVMRPSHVYKRFYMTIPSEWEKIHLSLVNQDIILLYKENTWCVRYNRDKQRGFGGLASGWNDFSVENNLEEFDVCKFELGRPAGSTVVMNVSIFRVVEELTPLIRVTAASSSAQKQTENARRISVGLQFQSS